METTNQNNINPNTVPVNTTIPVVKRKKIPKTLFGVFLLLILLVIFAIYLFGLKGGNISPQISPSSSPLVKVSPTPTRPLSSLATGSAFLIMDTNLNVLENDLNSVDLSEPKLSIPIIELNISFDK